MLSSNMRIPMFPLSTIGRLSISFLAFSSLVQYSVVAIPHIIHARQAPLLSALQLPGCAFRCFLTHLLDDGCTNEADFGCHCAGEKLIQASTACIVQGCGPVQKDEAVAKLRSACGKDLGGVVSQTGEPSTSSTSSTSSAIFNSETTNDKGTAVSTPTASASSTNSATTFPATIQIPSTAKASIPTTRSASTTLRSVSQTANPTATSTGTAIPLPDESGQLSTGAKVGIGVSVAVLPVIAAVILAWYIRRLKRRAHAAQQSDSTTAAPDPNLSMRGRQLTTNAYYKSPLSPSSPGGMRDSTTVSNIGYGMVMKKRGPILSILVEREDEDKNSVKEPVPGQKEGLAPPLELDGEGTAVWELPTSITPRSRSEER